MAPVRAPGLPLVEILRGSEVRFVDFVVVGVLQVLRCGVERVQSPDEALDEKFDLGTYAASVMLLVRRIARAS